jgi:CheY-like chemotaxis protein
MGMSATATRGEVMVVEDDYAIRETLRDVLEDEGFAVSSAANGQDALAHLAAGDSPRLILLDLMMPVMDGVEFRSVQQRDPRLSQIPVVVISAENGLEQTASNMAVEGFLAKPFELGALLATVQRYC